MNLYNIQNLFSHRLNFFEFNMGDIFILLAIILVIGVLWVIYAYILPIVYMAVQEVKVLSVQESRKKAREELIEIAAQQTQMEQDVEAEILAQMQDS